MTKLKELKEYIQKEIPEIIEDFEEQEQITDQVGNCVSQVVRPTGRINTYERPITLEDVLRVFHKGLTINENDGKRQTKMRDLTEFYLCPDGGVVDPLWEFGKPLDQQSEKTIEFLHELLIKNK